MTSDTSTSRPSVVRTRSPRPLNSRPRHRGRRIVSQVLLTLVGLLFLMPLVWMVASSLKSGGEVFSTPPKLLGDHLLFGNYSEAANYLPFGRFMLNTLFVAIAGTLITLVTSAMSAYAFARLRFRFREQVFLLYLGTLMVPQEVVVVPMFLIMKELGWVNSFQALILPWAFTAFGTFLLRQFFLTIPLELEEAAKIDGAGHWRILTAVIVPIAAPAFAVLAVFTFIGYWNSFLWPLIITNDTSTTTVPLGLNLFLGQNGQEWQLLMAAATISMAPTVLLVLVLQKYLVRGIALSGLGGR
ncbi:carbohydrate ABC transporter permease [Kineococcus sp. R86509]|uniref:carbohydrate ABC transporter permease n=1 Tax=Kineococcus sp. R86509 TaxID=3093851 RepID=UPI0036D2211F